MRKERKKESNGRTPYIPYNPLRAALVAIAVKVVVAVPTWARHFDVANHADRAGRASAGLAFGPQWACDPWRPVFVSLDRLGDELGPRARRLTFGVFVKLDRSS